MVRGSLGILATPNAPKAAGHGAAPAHHEGARKDGARRPPGRVGITLGDMWVKSTTPTAKGAKMTFAIKNEGTMHGFAIV